MSNVIERFFDAYTRMNIKDMEACLHPEYHLSDIGFDIKGKRGWAMWAMFCNNQSTNKLAVAEYKVGEVTEERGSADYRVTYLLDGRPIDNPIHSEFQLKDGLIIRQIDTCDFQNWAVQAKGFLGWLLCGTDFFKNKVKQTAEQRLSDYIAKSG